MHVQNIFLFFLTVFWTVQATAQFVGGVAGLRRMKTIVPDTAPVHKTYFKCMHYRHITISLHNIVILKRFRIDCYCYSPSGCTTKNRPIRQSNIHRIRWKTNVARRKIHLLWIAASKSFDSQFRKKSVFVIFHMFQNTKNPDISKLKKEQNYA